MFCPKCGNPDQSPETYCRQCGTFLPDLSKPFKKNQTPEEHVKVNTVLSSLTIVASFTLAAMLYAILGFRPETHWLIYLTAGLLIAMGVWHIQSLLRTHQLRKHFKKNKRSADDTSLEINAATGRLLEKANFDTIVPVSITDNTTKLLSEKEPRSS